MVKLTEIIQTSWIASTGQMVKQADSLQLNKMHKLGKLVKKGSLTVGHVHENTSILRIISIICHLRFQTWCKYTAWKSRKLITVPLFNDQLSSFLLFIEQMNPYFWVILSYGPWNKTDSIQQLEDFTPSNNSTFHSCFFEHVNCKKALFQTFFSLLKEAFFP